MLTKEKCKNALDYLFDNSLLDDFASNNDIEKYNVLEQLINEHFDNAPLKLEELEHLMWVWDDHKKEYIQLIYHDYGYGKEWVYEKIGVQHEIEFIFEKKSFL